MEPVIRGSHLGLALPTLLCSDKVAEFSQLASLPSLLLCSAIASLSLSLQYNGSTQQDSTQLTSI